MESAVNQEFSHRIRTAREKMGVPAKAVADAVGLSSGYFSRLENGLAEPPSLPKILALAEYLNLDGDNLAAVAGKMRPELLARFWSGASKTMGATTGLPGEAIKNFIAAQLLKVSR